MLRILLFCFILSAFTISIQGQISQGGTPLSASQPVLKTSAALPQITLDMPDAMTIVENDKENFPTRYGIYTDTLITLKESGRTDIIPGIGKIWRLRISSPEARSIQVVFDKFLIPEKATLFIYNDQMKSVYGAFTSRNVQENGSFTMADFAGNHVVIEYFEPENPRFSGTLIIGSIGQAFTDPLLSEAGPGFININCPIGKDAQLAKHSVCKMSFRSGEYQVTCSGALINNTENDGKPYFLTANHCLSTQAEASTLIAYFNYEVAGCDGNLQESPSLTGATLLATGQPSDFSLLLLNDIPPPDYQPYYAGWDVNDAAVDHVTGIHVPFNESKKISLDYDSIYSNPVSVTWDDDSRSPVGSHWIIGFDDGGTSQGSSGSPLFNSSNQIIGQLHGGDDIMAYYGKLSYSYAYKSQSYQTVRHYLDPDSTGVTSILGYAPADNIPDAFFTTRFDEVCIDAPIIFNDNSVFGPYERSWEIFPTTFAFINGTSDTSGSPVIEFKQDTLYTVSLKLSVDDELQSTEDFKIAAGSEISINVKSSAGPEICDCDFESFQLSAEGGEQFDWSILAGDENKITISQLSGDTTTVFRAPVFEADSSYTIGLQVIGSQATCSDTVVVTYDVLRQVNDNIEDAIELPYGMSDYYSNICATIEAGEPIPPFESCTTQNSWCDEYGTGEDIVENSVWFKFVASSTGRVSVSSTGMDNQIALYEADSDISILNGDYIILGANDDRSDTDYRPIIKSETVHPGDIYWIQVDGSGGGLEDDFYINITELSATPTEAIDAQRIIVYPQPAHGRVIMRHPDWVNGTRAEMAVYNTAGMVIASAIVDTEDGTISVNTSSWDPGVYFAAVKTGKGRYVAQIVKR